MRDRTSCSDHRAPGMSSIQALYFLALRMIGLSAELARREGYLGSEEGEKQSFGRQNEVLWPVHSLADLPKPHPPS